MRKEELEEENQELKNEIIMLGKQLNDSVTEKIILKQSNKEYIESHEKNTDYVNALKYIVKQHMG